jgi:hypothetical protein
MLAGYADGASDPKEYEEKVLRSAEQLETVT